MLGLWLLVWRGAAARHQGTDWEPLETVFVLLPGDIDLEANRRSIFKLGHASGAAGKGVYTDK